MNQDSLISRRRTSQSSYNSRTVRDTLPSRRMVFQLSYASRTVRETYSLSLLYIIFVHRVIPLKLGSKRIFKHFMWITY